RRRDRDGRRNAAVRGLDAGRRAPPRRRARCRGPQGLRRARAYLDARGDVPRGGRRGVVVSSVLTIAGYGFREALRRKVFVVVLVLTASFLALYWLANHYIFRDIAHVGPPAGIEPRPFAGAFIFGLAMFATLFLGTVLAVFLTLG